VVENLERQFDAALGRLAAFAGTGGEGAHQAELDFRCRFRARPEPEGNGQTGGS